MLIEYIKGFGSKVGTVLVSEGYEGHNEMD